MRRIYEVSNVALLGNFVNFAVFSTISVLMCAEPEFTLVTVVEKVQFSAQGLFKLTDHPEMLPASTLCEGK